MRLKAKLKWNNERVYIKPVFFSWNVGLQYKCLTGYKSSSIFCDSRDTFIFPLQTEFIMLFVKAWYWMKEYAYWQTRRKMIRRYRLLFSKRAEEELPF